MKVIIETPAAGGKTKFALQYVLEAGRPALFISTEDDAIRLRNRLGFSPGLCLIVSKVYTVQDAKATVGKVIRQPGPVIRTIVLDVNSVGNDHWNQFADVLSEMGFTVVLTRNIRKEHASLVHPSNVVI